VLYYSVLLTYSVVWHLLWPVVDQWPLFPHCCWYSYIYLFICYFCLLFVDDYCFWYWFYLLTPIWKNLSCYLWWWAFWLCNIIDDTGDGELLFLYSWWTWKVMPVEHCWCDCWFFHFLFDWLLFLMLLFVPPYDLPCCSQTTTVTGTEFIWCSHWVLPLWENFHLLLLAVLGTQVEWKGVVVDCCCSWALVNFPLWNWHCYPCWADWTPDRWWFRFTLFCLLGLEKILLPVGLCGGTPVGDEPGGDCSFLRYSVDLLFCCCSSFHCLLTHILFIDCCWCGWFIHCCWQATVTLFVITVTDQFDPSRWRHFPHWCNFISWWADAVILLIVDAWNCWTVLLLLMTLDLLLFRFYHCSPFVLHWACWCFVCCWKNGWPHCWFVLIVECWFVSLSLCCCCCWRVNYDFTVGICSPIDGVVPFLVLVGDEWPLCDATTLIPTICWSMTRLMPGILPWPHSAVLLCHLHYCSVNFFQCWKEASRGCFPVTWDLLFPGILTNFTAPRLSPHDLLFYLLFHTPERHSVIDLFVTWRGVTARLLKVTFHLMTDCSPLHLHLTLSLVMTSAPLACGSSDDCSFLMVNTVTDISSEVFQWLTFRWWSDFIPYSHWRAARLPSLRGSIGEIVTSSWLHSFPSIVFETDGDPDGFIVAGYGWWLADVLQAA